MPHPRTLLLCARPQFFGAILFPVLLAIAAAAGTGHWLTAILLLVGGVFIHGAANVLNDWADHRSGVDEANRSPLAPFAGGSRFIQRGLISGRATGIYGACLLLAALAVACLVSLPTQWDVLALLTVGCLMGVSYSLPPVKANYHGWGEILIILCFGVIPTAAAMRLFTGTWTTGAFAAGLPLGLAIAAVLLANEFPDRESDLAGGKRTLVHLIGSKPAAYVHAALLLGAFHSLPLLAAAKVLPWGAVAGGIAAFPAMQAIRRLLPIAVDGRGQDYLPAMKATIGAHMLLGVGMVTGTLIQRWIIS